MQKLLAKDKKRRRMIKSIENECFILKSIFKNFNFFALIR
jgi:hypothetical protein